MLLSFFASQYKQVSGSKEFLSAVLEEAGTGTEENQIYASVSIFCRLLAALAPEALPALPGHGDMLLESPSIVHQSLPNTCWEPVSSHPGSPRLIPV